MSRSTLSAAIDNDLSVEQWNTLLRAMDADTELVAEWSRAWALRDVQAGVQLKPSIARSGARDFAAGVMAAIAAEPAENAKVVKLDTHRAVRAAVAAPVAVKSRSMRRLRTLIPVSAAAGVAAAVITVNLMRGEPAGNVVEASANQLAGSEVANRDARRDARLVATGNDARDPLEARRAALLNSYLLEHSNSVAERGMGGSLANARFAARTADYRPDAE